MNQHGISPEKVTKPIQLLAAWLIGLFVTNGSFLFAARQIEHPSWGSAMLLIAAVANVPVFIGSLFLLQTKFRPQMQEDSYYSRYLDEERKFGSVSKSLSRREVDAEIAAAVEKIVQSIGVAAEGKEQPIKKILQDSQLELMIYKHGSARALSELFKARASWGATVKKWGQHNSFVREVDGFLSDGLASKNDDDLNSIELTELGVAVATEAENKGLLFAQKCNDPALPAQIRPLKHKPRRVSSCRAPGAGVGGCKTRSSRRSRDWRVAGFRSGGDGRIAP